MQRAEGFLIAYGKRLLLQNGTRVHSGIEQHDTDPGDLFAFEQRALNRSSTAVARQQRGVDINGSAGWLFQQTLRQQLAVSHHNKALCLVRSNLPDGLLGPNPFRLKNRNAKAFRHSFDGRWGDLFPPPSKSIRLSDDQKDIRTGCGKFSQGRNGKLRCSQKD